MMTLEDEIADYIEGHYRDRAEALDVAKSILAIPDIAAALAMLAEERARPTRISIFDLARMAGVDEETISGKR